MQNYRSQNFRGAYRGIYRNDNLARGRSRSQERQSSDNLTMNDRSSGSRSRSVSRASTNREVSVADTYDNLTKTNVDDIIVNHLNL